MLFRNDGSRFWLLATAPGDSAGAYSGIRPFSFDLSTGRTFISNAATVENGLTVTGGLAVTGNENLHGNLQVGNVPGAGYAWGNNVIASQDYFVEVKGSGSVTGSTGYVFHNPNVSTAAIMYKNTAGEVGYFNFSSDDASWNVRINSANEDAVNTEGGYRSAGNGFWHDNQSAHVWALRTGWLGQPPKDTHWGGVVSGNGDGATSTTANVKMLSWYGIGFGPSIDGQTIPKYENAMFLNVRSGQLNVRGVIYGSDVRTSSDARLKSNFATISSPVDKVKRLVGKLYDKLPFLTAPDTAKRREAGLIAQDVMEVLPEAVTEADDKDKILTISGAAINALLVEALKDVIARLEALEARAV